MLYQFLRLLVVVFALIGLGSMIAAAYFLKPFGLASADISVEEASVSFVRLSDRAVQQEALFSTPCDPGGPHLYLGDGKDVRLPLYLRWPGDLLDIANSDYAAPGNRFLLEGYPVTRSTGEAITPALYFDVTAWSPITPYRIWQTDGENIREKTDVTEPVTFRSTAAEPVFEISPHSGKGGC